MKSYSKLPCKRSAIGASGSMMTLHALDTSTSCIALRLIRLAMDRDPRVATSLWVLVVMGIACYDGGHVAYQIVATPCSGDVRTNVRIVSHHASSDLVRWLKGYLLSWL